MIFDDRYRPALHDERKQQRDPKIPILGPKECKRCNRTKDLERDHIKTLSHGGSDTTENLQWLCWICHKVKTTEDRIQYGLRDEASWRYKMWMYRLEALRKLNPPGQEYYVSYWDDPKTHRERWVPTKNISKMVEKERNLKLEQFI